AVLDGGLQAWTDAHQPLTTAPPIVRPTRFTAAPRSMHVDVETLRANLHRAEVCIIDARAPDRFRGENETLDPVGGHIPGARNRFFRNNLDANGRFKSAEALDREWRTALGSTTSAQVVHQCGSGVTACHNVLAMEIAGLSGSRLYPGSWSEWCADASRPIAKGDAT
ncbi:MAG TPA: rhodanese-like domain-containing protein, partial [Burkholderiales bacterium]